MTTREALRVTTTIPVAPTTLYYAWLDSVQHSAMTGGAAKLVNEVGGKFSTWDGYITGQLVALDLGRRIVMSWRTTDFPEQAPDSRVEVHFEALGGNTRVLVLHTDIPEGQSETYRGTWNDKYFHPMRTHFSKFLPDPRLPPPVRKPPPPPEPDDEDEDDEESAPKFTKKKKHFGSSARIKPTHSTKSVMSERLSKKGLSAKDVAKPIEPSKKHVAKPAPKAVESAPKTAKKENVKKTAKVATKLKKSSPAPEPKATKKAKPEKKVAKIAKKKVAPAPKSKGTSKAKPAAKKAVAKAPKAKSTSKAGATKPSKASKPTKKKR